MNVPRTNAKTSTGEIPRVDPLDLAEPVERPRDLPEQRHPGATTGIMPAVRDVADPDKFADDSAKGYV